MKLSRSADRPTVCSSKVLASMAGHTASKNERGGARHRTAGSAPTL